MKHLKHLKYTLATWVFNEMSSYCLDEWRLVVVELHVCAEVDGGAWCSSCGSGASNSSTGRLHTKLTPLCRLDGEATAARQSGGGGRGKHGRARAGSAVEADMSERGRAGEFYSFGEDTIVSGVDASVLTGAHVESLSQLEVAEQIKVVRTRNS